MSMFVKVTLSLLSGLSVTFKIFALTLLFALPLGLIISFGSMSRFKVIKWPVKTLIWVIRGTPLMLQLIIFGFGPGLLSRWASKADCCEGLFTALASWDFTWLANIFTTVLRAMLDFVATWHTFDTFYAVILAFVINYACYFSEIFRGGIEGIPKGQYEAGAVLGLTKVQMFFKIVLMQVVKITYYIEGLYMLTPLVAAITFGIILAFNLVAGLIPVFTTMRKTPAQILARTDI